MSQRDDEMDVSVRGALRSVLLLMSVSVFLGACEGEEGMHPPAWQSYERAEQHSASSPAGGAVVARVGERGVITEAGVRWMWLEHPEWRREQVIEALMEQELLAAHYQAQAASRQEALEAPMALARKRAMVRGWLERELEASPEGVAPTALEERAQQIRQQVDFPKGYTASHLLVRVPKEASEQEVARARAVSEALAAELERGGDVSGLAMQRLELASGGRRDGFELIVNRALSFPEEGAQGAFPKGWVGVVPEFARGAAQVATQRGVGALSAPVKSAFGWHLIVVEAIHPARPAPQDEVLEAARAQLTDEARVAKLVSELERLLKQDVWSTDPSALEEETGEVASSGAAK